MSGITFSIDLEDPTCEYSSSGRWVSAAHRLLDFCDQVHRRATFFTVGRVVESAPNLIKSIAQRGHEIAYHSHDHVFLTEDNPEKFLRESRIDKDKFEQLTGKQLLGFRAPGFSLTPKTVWALDVLKELGFRYSSSVMPTRISRFGFPKIPLKPFVWPNGIIEFPLPVATPFCVPFLGGVYLYAMPKFLMRYWLNGSRYDGLWTYTHPFDFDVEEPFNPFPNTPYWVCWIMWKLRPKAERKIREILELGNAVPFGEKLDIFQ